MPGRSRGDLARSPNVRRSGRIGSPARRKGRSRRARGGNRCAHGGHGGRGRIDGAGTASIAGVLRRMVGAAVLRRTLAPGDDRAGRRCGCARKAGRAITRDDLGDGVRTRAGARRRRTMRVRCRGRRRTCGADRLVLPCSSGRRRCVLFAAGSAARRGRAATSASVPSRRRPGSRITGNPARRERSRRSIGAKRKSYSQAR